MTASARNTKNVRGDAATRPRPTKPKNRSGDKAIAQHRTRLNIQNAVSILISESGMISSLLAAGLGSCRIGCYD